MTKLPSVDHMIQAFSNYFGDLYKLPAEVNSPAYKKAYAQLRDRLKGDFANVGIADRFSWETQTAPKPKAKAAPAKPAQAKVETQTPAKVGSKPAKPLLLPEVKAGKTGPAFKAPSKMPNIPALESKAGKAVQVKNDEKPKAATAKQTAAKAPAKAESKVPVQAKTQTSAKKAVFKGSMFTKPRPAQVARHV